MKFTTGKGRVILSVIVATILFSFLRMIQSFFPITNIFVEWGWSLLEIILVSTLIQMIPAGFAVLVVMPPVLGFKPWREWLPGYLRIGRETVMMGILSFLGFCVLATGISLGMGIFKGDLSVVFSIPDIQPDPDLIGWGYFILALVPGIWEELAFRGLIQSKLQKSFPITASVLLSAIFFGLFHLTNLLTQGFSRAIPGVVMAIFFGIGWGYLTVKARSVVPGIISHYLVDSLGQIFLGVDSTDPALTTGFFILLVLLFPVWNIVLTMLMEKGSDPGVLERSGAARSLR